MPRLPWRNKPSPARKPPFRNTIVGVCRFSYPALSAFRKTPTQAEEARAMLYDPARLERRFALFEALMLPSLEAQSDRDFQMGFVIGDDFPQPFRQRLETLLKRLPGAYLHPHPPAPNYKATHSAYKAADLDGASHLTSFRLDDDDAMDRDFIARLRRQAQGLHPLSGGKPFVIGQTNGFWLETGRRDGADTPARIYDVHERTPACGVALVSGVKSGLTAYVHNHRDLAERFSTYLDAVTPAFIRTVHRDNDAAPHVAGSKNKFDQAEIKAQIERHFPFSLAQLLAL